MGWPRKKGLFRRKEIVPTAFLERQVSFLFRSAIAIGMSMPREAIGVILDNFRTTDWDTTSIEDILHEVDPESSDFDLGERPWVTMNALSRTAPKHVPCRKKKAKPS